MMRRTKSIFRTSLSRLSVLTVWFLHSCALLTMRKNIGTEEKPDMRTVLHFHPALAPVKIGVLPLSKKLNEGAEKVFTQSFPRNYNCEFDDRGNIGKRYRRQDEIGTPFCVTYDFDSETDGAVTVRDRDTMEQERVKIEELRCLL